MRPNINPSVPANTRPRPPTPASGKPFTRSPRHGGETDKARGHCTELTQGQRPLHRAHRVERCHEEDALDASSPCHGPDCHDPSWPQPARRDFLLSDSQLLTTSLSRRLPLRQSVGAEVCSSPLNFFSIATAALQLLNAVSTAPTPSLPTLRLISASSSPLRVFLAMTGRMAASASWCPRLAI